MPITIMAMITGITIMITTTRIMATIITMRAAVAGITTRKAPCRAMSRIAKNMTITGMRITGIMAGAAVVGMIISTTMAMTMRMVDVAAVITTTSMTDLAELQRQQWFSPAFPVGGYAYSHGIEKAVETGDVRDAATLTAWISGILGLGAGRNDAILLAEGWRRAGEEGTDRLTELAELGLALGLSSERRLETLQQGAAFYRLVAAAWPDVPLPDLDALALPYPIAVGIAGQRHGQSLQPLISAYLQAFASNLIAAGLRLAVIGQSEAQVRLVALLPIIRAVALEAEAAGLEGLGGMAFRSDLMSIRHETQSTRLFRS